MLAITAMGAHGGAGYLLSIDADYVPSMLDSGSRQFSWKLKRCDPLPGAASWISYA
jgi:hypothetical protein